MLPAGAFSNMSSVDITLLCTVGAGAPSRGAMALFNRLLAINTFVAFGYRTSIAFGYEVST
jgi:hypothetical protein